jgi:hypothetical protein
MKSKPTNLHKRLAMGDSLGGYAKGGLIGSGKLDAGVTAKQSPLTKARRENGIKGMKTGGKC